MERHFFWLNGYIMCAEKVDLGQRQHDSKLWKIWLPCFGGRNPFHSENWPQHYYDFIYNGSYWISCLTWPRESEKRVRFRLQFIQPSKSWKRIPTTIFKQYISPALKILHSTFFWNIVYISILSAYICTTSLNSLQDTSRLWEQEQQSEKSRTEEHSAVVGTWRIIVAMKLRKTDRVAGRKG